MENIVNLEAKVVVIEIPIIDDGRIQTVCILHDDAVMIYGNHGTVLASVLVRHREEIINHI